MGLSKNESYPWQSDRLNFKHKDILKVETHTKTHTNAQKHTKGRKLDLTRDQMNHIHDNQIGLISNTNTH